MTAAGLRLVLQNAARDPDAPSKTFIGRCARNALAGAVGELVVRIVDEEESAVLNERYRGKPGPTNVLAFASGGLPAASDEPAPLGDIVICAAVVAREAAAQGKSLESHWAHMVVHACLHLVGYDHTRADEAALMEARERELLADLGVADPYAAGA